MKLNILYEEVISENNFILIKTDDYLVLIDLSIKKIIGMVSFNKIKPDLFDIGSIAANKGYGSYLFKLLLSYLNNWVVTDRYSSTSEQAINMLYNIKKDDKVITKVLDVNDEDYVVYKNKNKEYNDIINTCFKIKNPLPELNKLISNGLKFVNDKDNPDEFLKNLNEKAFKFFKNKLN